MAIEDFFKPLVRKRPTHGTNNKGEPTKTYTDTNIKGYYNGPPAGNAQFSAGKWSSKYQTKLLCDDSDIQHNDIVVIDSENWRVIGPRADGGNKTHHYEVLIERIDQVD